MENLALLAVQAQNVISSGNAVLNATQVSVYPMLNLGMLVVHSRYACPPRSTCRSGTCF
jgi:hypothetical protein